MRFRNKRTEEIKNAYSLEIRGDKACVRFTENGKEYAYNKDNIEVLDETGAEPNSRSFTVYRLNKSCYKCGKTPSVLTYIVFSDDTNEDVTFPWDKKRLLKNQNVFAHIQDPSIEYYGLKIVGDDDTLDQLIMQKYPSKIQTRYSKTQMRSYAMNLCDHCGATQGQNFIYRQINELIKEMQPIEKLE